MDEEILIYTCLDRKYAVQKYPCILQMCAGNIAAYLGYPTRRQVVQTRSLRLSVCEKKTKKTYVRISFHAMSMILL